MKHILQLTTIILFLWSLPACQSDNGRGGMPQPAADTQHLEDAAVKPANFKVGHVIDEYKGVPVYYNGSPLESQGRHKSPGGYNYGMKWQCVEFVKRYYYDRLKHSMPNTYGHAKDFFIEGLEDGGFNIQRDLYQFQNGGIYKPQADDIVVYIGDEYGHVAIITEVGDDYVNIIQQNVGKATRHTIPFLAHKNHYYIMNRNIVGFLGRRWTGGY